MNHRTAGTAKILFGRLSIHPCSLNKTSLPSSSIAVNAAPGQTTRNALPGECVILQNHTIAAAVKRMPTSAAVAAGNRYGFMAQSYHADPASDLLIRRNSE